MVLFAAMCVMGAVYHEPGWRRFHLDSYLLTALICLPLAVRRLAPMLVLLLVSLAYVAYLTVGHSPSLNYWGPVLALYSLAGLRPNREAACGALVTAAVLFYSGMTPQFPWAAALVQATAVPAGAWILGGLTRQLAERNRQLAETTARLREEQRRRAEQAVAEERLRIARELHDVVAHHVAVISMQAGLASYVFDTDPATARGAVDVIGGTSRETLRDMRRLLTLLRGADGPGAPDADAGGAADPLLPEDGPAPGLDRLPALAERVRAAGVDVVVDLADDVRTLPSALQLTVYRVVQEALTNVLKHAGPCRAEVRLRRDGQRLTVRISNDAGSAPPPAEDSTGDGGGHGLVGMRERARLYGGTVTAGPCVEGGFAVELTMPLP